MRKALIFALGLSLLIQIRVANAELDWRDSYSDALAEARNIKKPVLIFFSSPDCDECLKFEEEVFKSPAVSKLVAKFVLVKTDEEDILKQYRVPMHHNIVILDEKGKVFTRIWGPLSLKRFNEVMEVAYISILTFEAESALAGKAYGEANEAVGRAYSCIQNRTLLRKHFSGRLKKVKQSVETTTKEWLKQAENKMMEKDYLGAYAIYDQMAREFQGLEVAEKAKKEIKRLESDPTLPKEIEPLRFNALLISAENARQQGRFDRALEIYQELLSTYAGTEYAKRAAEEKLKVVDKLAEGDCKGWMSLAKNYLINNNEEKALEYYRKVVEKHPDSSYAKEARRKIEEITRGNAS